jgi:ribosomal protein S18 acetylase RimI-like enzyme
MFNFTRKISASRAIYNEIAHIHASSINQGFLSTLGENFLGVLYESIDLSSDGILFIKQENGKVIGFVAGAQNMRSIYFKMIVRLPRVLWALLPIIFSPLKIKFLFETIIFGLKNKPLKNSPSAELLSIAVLEGARGCGVAQELYQKLADFFFQMGEEAFCIVVGESLIAANHFYEKMGAIPIAKIKVHGGKSSTLYRQKLPVLNSKANP